MIHLTLIRRPGGRRSKGHHAAYPGEGEVLQRKDFGTIPACSSMRPLTSQRIQAARRVD